MKVRGRVAGIGHYTVLLMIAVGYACGVSPSVVSSDDFPRLQFVRMDQQRYRDRVFNDVEVRENILYRSLSRESRDGEGLRLDVYLPHADKEHSRPAILWIHGGGLFGGETRKQGYVVELAAEFARRGYVSVAPDFRLRIHLDLGWKSMLREAVDDCRAALDWMRAHNHIYGINPDWIALGGGSAGGVVAVSLASLENTTAAQRGERGVFALIDLWGSPPLFYTLGEINTHFPPSVILHGTQDTALPFFLSESFAAKLKEVSVYHLLHPIPGAPHTPTAHMAEITETIAQFLYTLLGKGFQR